MTNPHNDPYVQVIADLERKRADIERVIESLKSLRGVERQGSFRGIVGAPMAMAKPVNDAGGEFSGLNMGDAARIVIERAGRPVGNQEIMEALESGGLASTAENPLNTIGAIVNRRAKTVGDIVSVGRGLWALKEWDSTQQNNENHSSQLGEG